MSKEVNNFETPLFGNNHQEGYAYHNVGALFRAGDPQLRQKLDSHYGKRGGHIPDFPTTGLLVTEIDQAILDQVAYLNAIYDRKLTTRSISELTNMSGALVVPYINLPEEVEKFNKYGIETWGLHPTLVDQTKNKARAHELFKKHTKTGFEVPDHLVGDVRELPGYGHHYYHRILRDYAAVGMYDYKPGLVIRAAESDGGYGSVRLEINGDQKKPYQVFNDGAPKVTESYDSLSKALNHSKDYLLSSANSKTDVEPRVVVSRLMDVKDSPGLSVVINKGQTMSLGWNGQVQSEGGNACIGTSNYKPKDEFCTESQKQFEQSTAENFVELLKQLANERNINFNEVSGFANIDLMIPGPQERKFRQRLGLDPNTIYLAEINPRITNLTDALLALVWAQKGFDRITTANIKDTMSRGILTVDTYPLPAGVSIEQFRRYVQNIDMNLSAKGTRVLLRMPDQPNAGLILAGDINKAQEELAKIA